MIRIVFVDDDANVLRAMQRSFHGMRSTWDMEFVAGGAAALESLNRCPADAVISDMRMPGMDGWQLLTEVMNRHPRAVRILLSGQSDGASVMLAVGAAHQYLDKPCDSGAIKQAIARTQGTRRLLSDEHLIALVGRVGMLPPAPQVFQQLLRCLQSENYSLTEVARIIDGDVSMTANILKLVNSPFFGSRQPIITIERAVAYLGTDTIGSLVLGQGAFNPESTGRVASLDHARLWRHGLQVAVAARTIAMHDNLPRAQVEEAFLAALLHDIGKLVLPAPSPRVPQGSNPTGHGPGGNADNHAEVGAYLLSLWAFPTAVVEAVAYHHDLTAAKCDLGPLAAIVNIANRYTHHRSEQPHAAFGMDEPDARITRWLRALDAIDFDQTPVHRAVN
jgi:putative nucleotidyltransferase with HDIG domain